MKLENKCAGFTLIEVLIAVIVLSIALIAVVRNTSQVARQTSYLQDRTIAHWVAMDIMAQLQTNIIQAPMANTKGSGYETMLNQSWAWQAVAVATNQVRVVKIQVSVYKANTSRQLDSVSSYILLPKNQLLGANR